MVSSSKLRRMFYKAAYLKTNLLNFELKNNLNMDTRDFYNFN